jgi:hypothetical protein
VRQCLLKDEPMPDFLDILQPAMPEPARLLVCLPADAADDLHHLVTHLVLALAPHVAMPGALLDNSHFLLRSHADPAESPILLPTTDPASPTRTWCAGGPIGLLDLDATLLRLRQAAADDLATWQTAVDSTPVARPWRHYLDAHRSDPQRYAVPDAVADFAAQPRIAAIRAAADQLRDRDMYGPGLEALAAGVDVYTDFQAGLVTFGDGLIGPDGDLHVPAGTARLVEQTLAERQHYHQTARQYLDRLDSQVVVTAVRCLLDPTTTVHCADRADD